MMPSYDASFQSNKLFYRKSEDKPTFSYTDETKTVWKQSLQFIIIEVETY